MPSPEDCEAWIRYDRRVYEAFLRRLRRLPWKSLIANRESGHHSIRNTLVHILHVHEAWHQFIVPGRVSELSREGLQYDDFTGWPKLLDYERQVFEGIERRTARLTPRELRRRVKAPWMPGIYTVADAYLQSSIEQAHHLGEIIALLWQKDLAPPAMTWIETMHRPRSRGRGRR